MTAIPYPRSQFIRSEWINLNSEWSFEFDLRNTTLERGREKADGILTSERIPKAVLKKIA